MFYLFCAFNQFLYGLRFTFKSIRLSLTATGWVAVIHVRRDFFDENTAILNKLILLTIMEYRGCILKGLLTRRSFSFNELFCAESQQKSLKLVV